MKKVFSSATTPPALRRNVGVVTLTLQYLQFFLVQLSPWKSSASSLVVHPQLCFTWRLAALLQTDREVTKQLQKAFLSVTLHASLQAYLKPCPWGWMCEGVHCTCQGMLSWCCAPYGHSDVMLLSTERCHQLQTQDRELGSSSAETIWGTGRSKAEPESQNHGIIESFRLEKTYKIVKSNCKRSTAKPTTKPSP